ncbi:MAG: NAD-dependent epimerase/dehydratase family protein, partial [Prolixibacteraceae bacterium]|nr:NAD-dependent epimerase/dehydratase family protein [Prolixibacteraceae bacterium]
EHLLNAEKQSKGKLIIFEADLLEPGSFEPAMQNCELVIHTASPFQISGIKDAQKELIEPALQGTKNVLDSVNNTASVKRVVLTSSMVAIYGDACDILTTEDGVFTENHWNKTSSVTHQPYPYSKTLAEKEAWKMAGEQDRWDLNVINPGFILGPSLSKRTDSTSINLILQLTSGKFKTGVPAGAHGNVDVRDVAKAHILAGFTSTASGRHITAAHEADFLEMANIIRKKYPSLPLPKGYVPKWLFKLIAPAIGFTRKYVKNNVGYDVKFDNSYIKKDLGIEFIPFEKTIIDFVDQLIKDGLIKIK